MSMRAIVRPEALVTSGISGLIGGANVLRPEPKQVAVSSGGYLAVQANLPGATLVDTLLVGFVGSAGVALDGLTFSFLALRAGNQVQLGAASLLATRVRSGRRHALLQLSQPQVLDVVAFYLDGAPAGISIGLFAAGLAFRPTWGGEWGGGVGLVDTASVTRRKDGGFGIDPGVRAMLPQWTFGDLSDTERTDLFGLLHGCGESEPMLVIEGDDTGPTLSEQIHWGLFTRIEAYERTAPGTTRWSLRFQDWV